MFWIAGPGRDLLLPFYYFFFPFHDFVFLPDSKKQVSGVAIRTSIGQLQAAMLYEGSFQKIPLEFFPPVWDCFLDILPGINGKHHTSLQNPCLCTFTTDFFFYLPWSLLHRDCCECLCNCHNTGSFPLSHLSAWLRLPFNQSHQQQHRPQPPSSLGVR